MSDRIINSMIYALLVGVGDYESVHLENLPTYSADLAMIHDALLYGLKASEDHIRTMEGDRGNGSVKATDFARVMSGFKLMLSEEATFIIYFSGHGGEKRILFSDRSLELQSLIDYINDLPVKNKIVILDCCYAGDFQTSGARKLQFEEHISDFAGHGIAVMASSSPDEVSRLGPGADHSMFTGALATAIGTSARVRRGKLSLSEICEETRYLVENWNRQYPGREQHPVFRTSLGGDIYFYVEDYHPYRKKEIRYETSDYMVVNVKPLSTVGIKRLCAFVIPKRDVSENPAHISRFTKEIAKRIRYAEVHSNQKSEARHHGMPARAIWCYFAADQSDVVNSLYYAYSIWTADEEMQKHYFKLNQYALIEDGIYIFNNASYHVIKSMQQPTKTREEFIDNYKGLLVTIVDLAEQFVVDLQEVMNRTISLERMQERYGRWITSVKKTYLRLSEEDIAPDDLHDWSEEIMELAGWVLDLALVLENRDSIFTGSHQWLIQHAIREYQTSLERLKELEKSIAGLP